MRHSYNSKEYWDNLINANKTIRGHMFMENLPSDRSLYFHSLIFSKGNGLNNIWGYFPDEMALLGYIQYSFLQEAFYQWVNCRDKAVHIIPLMSVDDIIKDGERRQKISKEEADIMRKHLAMVKRCWNLPKNKIINELNKFAREFNRTWYGDHREFLYFKIFKTPSDLGEFVINSSYMTSTEDGFVEKTGKTITQWKAICAKADKDKINGNEFKEILLKKLSEVI